MYVPTIEETVTATHPPVMPLKPVRAERPPARVPATEATGASLETAAPAHSDVVRAEVVVGRAFRWLIAGRIAAVAALAVVVYLAISQNWVGDAAEAFITWYTATIVPYLEVSFVSPEAPTVQDGLVGPVLEVPLPVTD